MTLFSHSLLKMAKKKKKSLVKTKKKRWFSIIAPKIFLEQEIGESYAENIYDLKGKYVRLNLMSLTNDPKKRGINIIFKVDGIKGDRATTRIIGYYLVPATIKRMVKRGKDRLDVYVREKTKDGQEVIIKPMLITKSRTKGSVQTNLINSTKLLLLKKIKEKTYDDLIQNIVQQSIQREIAQTLKKIYPISIVQIRVFKLKSEGSDLSIKENTVEVEDKTKEAPEQAEQESSEENK